MGGEEGVKGGKGREHLQKTYCLLSFSTIEHGSSCTWSWGNWNQDNSTTLFRRGEGDSSEPIGLVAINSQLVQAVPGVKEYIKSYE